ncbi:efflux RND transporter periplasmic adaptor subunit [Paraburkholderia acidisoli]|uniref:Efflux RND transporter periplasmic adaptor subunit n=1 Tax=Paraburkholderia acidisoli TaxID=2571748 RepID=A0A7Z2GQ72_9BURK|nr:efflux RND transporter periplasmic adaptor subunit [Paraburkholderia acidisoli]QGZ65669.1 efflux RND transporter periplasmic adaptor subunit [Paraburkholderia acidisoli]
MNDFDSPDDTGAPHATPAAPPVRSRGRGKTGFVLAALALALLAAGVVPRLHASRALAAQTAQQATLAVSVVQPQPAPAEQELVLPGAATPYADAAIYARTTGYVAHWYTDIGTHVTAGQVLADIAAPDLNAQLDAARADAAQAAAAYAYAKSTAARWQTMLQSQSVAQQDADAKTSDMQTKQAALAAAQANVARLAQLVSFEKITAPFDGVVTARDVDVGALVTAGGTPGSASAANELFHVSQTQTLRVFVDVPQDAAPQATPAAQVWLTTQQYPGRRFAARVARNAGAIDPVSRTLRVEIDVDNAAGALLPGAYVQAHLALKTAAPALEVPASTLLFRPDGVAVATVDGRGRVRLKLVHLGRDFGTRVEVASGLVASDRVIDNPGDSIVDGEAVSIAATTGAPQDAAKAAHS